MGGTAPLGDTGGGQNSLCLGAELCKPGGGTLEVWGRNSVNMPAELSLLGCGTQQICSPVV